MLLVLAMLLSLFPGITPKAYADGTLETSVTGLTVSHTSASSSKGSAFWSASGTSITGTATGYTQFVINNKITTKLTLTNSSGGEATLSFDYTLDGGGSVSGAISDTSGSYSGILADGAALTITLTSPKGADTCTLSITGLSLISTSAGDVTTTFKPAEGGSYTVNGEEITAETTKTDPAGTEYTVSATAASGYQFFGWYNETTGEIMSYDTPYTFKASAVMTLVPKFISSTTAVFGVGAAKFDNLTEAGAYAAAGSIKTIVLLNDGTVSGRHTIPAGTTLVIPFDDNNAYFTTAPDYSTTASTPKAYRTLTLTSGASINVEGAISVGAKHYTSSGTNNGNPTGAYGYIVMQDGSSITVKDGGALYAWGYISGRGHITAESGAAVYEYFQIADWRGGTATSSMKDKSQKVFPFSQYYAQNIEASLTLKAGATENVYTSITANLGDKPITVSAKIPFVGSKNAMFVLSEGSTFTKTYDPTTDRIVFDVNGNASLNSIKLSTLSFNVNSNDYVLPINNNVTLKVHSGTTTVNQDVCLQPGVQVYIDKGAELKVASGCSLYVYDQDQWGNYCRESQFKSVVYSPTRAKTRSNADLVDVVIDVNGALTADGYLYTTAGGADIKTSAGTGTVVLTNGAGTATTTYQATQSNSDITYEEIPITAAKLHNGGQYVGTEDEYTLTDGAAAGTSYTYNPKEKWAAPCTEHTPDEAVVENNTEPTCTGTGSYDSVVYCTVCGEEISRDTITVPATGHDYANTVTKEATCTEAGVMTNTCAKCGDSYTDAIPATGHTAVIDEAVYATCTKNGLTEGKHCSACGEILVKQNATEALGHNYQAETSVPSQTEPCITTYTCSRCADTYIEYVTGLYSVGDDTYYLDENSLAVTGLVRLETETGEVNYYYFAVQKNVEENPNLEVAKAVKNLLPEGGKDCWIHKTNDLPLPQWGYYFDENGVILHDENTSKNGVLTDNGVLYYYVDGIKAPAGLIKSGDYYYYANSKGQLIVNQTYYCTRMNGLMTEGAYAFDESGKMIIGATEKNGIFAENGSMYYYKDGQVTYAGLIEIDGDYYYVRSNGEVVHGQTYWISWTHGLMDAGYYTFDESGKLTGVPKNGIVEENGSLYYYANGTKVYAGLIQIGSDYYYVKSNCEVVHGCSYWVSKTNGLLPEGNYIFDEDGKLQLPEKDETKDGIVAEDGSLYYYANGIRTYAGLIQIDGDYYYVNSQCEVVHGRAYYISLTHGLRPQGVYTFADDGRMIVD